jgi:hypothetical protein
MKYSMVALPNPVSPPARADDLLYRDPHETKHPEPHKTNRVILARRRPAIAAATGCRLSQPLIAVGTSSPYHLRMIAGLPT